MYTILAYSTAQQTAPCGVPFYSVHIKINKLTYCKTTLTADCCNVARVNYYNLLIIDISRVKVTKS